MKSTRIMQCCALCVCAMAATVAQAAGTGFETSDGFTVGGAWPAGLGWSGSALISTANPASGAQSLAVPTATSATYSASYTLPTTEPTLVSVDICTSAHSPNKSFNFASYGYFYPVRQDDYSAGGLSFYLKDQNDALSGNQYPDASEYQIEFWNTHGGDMEVVGSFTIGTWYHYEMLIDPVADTVTHTLTLLNGSPIAQRTYSNAVSKIKSIRFYGSQTPTSAAYIDNAYLGEIPEPASLGLLVLGGLAMIRRRRAV